MDDMTPTPTTPISAEPRRRVFAPDAIADAKAVYEFLRQPDWRDDDEFDLVVWLNDRPCAAAYRLAHPVPDAKDATIAAQAARIEELEAALRPFAEFSEAIDHGMWTVHSTVAERSLGAFRRSIMLEHLRTAAHLLTPTPAPVPDTRETEAGR